MGRVRVKDQHLHRRSGWYHYVRRTPSEVVEAFGKAMIEVSLRTKDVAEARRQRDKLSRSLEQQWQRLRDKRSTRKDVAAALADDEEQRLYQAYLHWRDTHDDTDEAPGPADMLLDELDRRAERYAKGSNAHDLDEARDTYAQTGEGMKFTRMIRAAQGEATVAIAGKQFLESAAVGEATKDQYSGVYQFASNRLPTPRRVTRDQAREFIQGLAADNKSKSTITHYRAALRALWSHLGLDETMWSGFRVDARKAKFKRDKWEDAEVVTLLTKIKPLYIRQAMFIAAHTGARADEVCTMEYDPTTDHIRFPKSKTKAGLRTIPCPEVVREVVTEWVASKRPSQHYLSKKFSEHKRALGFSEAKVFHSFRHTVSSKLHDAGVQEATAAIIIGHKHKALTFGLYGNKVAVEKLRPHLEKVKYEGVTGCLKE